jgi:hypothetical protein
LAQVQDQVQVRVPEKVLDLEPEQVLLAMLKSYGLYCPERALEQARAQGLELIPVLARVQIQEPVLALEKEAEKELALGLEQEQEQEQEQVQVQVQELERVPEKAQAQAQGPELEQELGPELGQELEREREPGLVRGLGLGQERAQ